MATTFEELSADQTRRIYRNFVKGIPKEETKRKFAIDDATYEQVIGLYRKRTHPNDVGGTPLGPRDLLASRLDTGSRATEGPIQAYSPRDMKYDSAERTYEALEELAETSAEERDAIREEGAEIPEDPEVLRQQAREHAEKVRQAEAAAEEYQAFARQKHYEDNIERDKKAREAADKKSKEERAQEAKAKTQELEERAKKFEDLKKELEKRQGAAVTPTAPPEADAAESSALVSEAAQEIIDSHKLSDEEMAKIDEERVKEQEKAVEERRLEAEEKQREAAENAAKEAEERQKAKDQVPVLPEKAGQPPVHPAQAAGSAPIGPGPAKGGKPPEEPAKSKGGHPK